jgi:dTDP-glucose 4,6-dehydratase
MKKTILVTGGAGFIGSAVIRHILDNSNFKVINIDKLTYASNLSSLKKYEKNKNYIFKKIDICNRRKIFEIFKKYLPELVMHLAAETHVDRSINAANNFIKTNILGTYNMLEVSREYYKSLNIKNKKKFRFHHISTDEVYGDLKKNSPPADEDFKYSPSSPYSASKASADHLVRSWFRTYNLPVIISNCSNNYGPNQFPEKLIPLIILNALEKKKLPIYGNGQQIRDWLYVNDHAEALFKIITKGKVGETYNIGGKNQIKNIDVVKIICNILDKIKPLNIKNKKYSDLIVYVKDRPGHDKRYAINTKKIQNKLNWHPKESFKTGIYKTIKWYMSTNNLVENFGKKKYARKRLGLIK